MKTTISIIILQLFALTLVSQTKKYKDITISGHFSKKAQSEIFRDTEFWYYNEAPLHDFIITSNHKFTMDNGNFNVKIKNNDKYGFFRCRATQIPSLCIDYFLVQQGDSIYMDIKEKTNVSFSGRGSEKLNYQHFAGKLIQQYQFITHEDSLEYKENPLDFRLLKYQESLKICLDSLEKLKSTTDPTIIEILRINTISLISNNYQDILALDFYFTDDQKQKSRTINFLRWTLQQQHLYPVSDTTIIKYAINYADYLKSTQVNFSKIINGVNKYEKISLEKTFKEFQNNYSGLLRDKLITSLLLQLHLDPELQQFAKESLEFVKTQPSVDEILKIINRKSKGSPAFNFTFETAEGKEIQLSDFRGSIIIVDTWYNGCTNCVTLAKLLAPLVEKYSKTKTVTFLSVNVDYKRERFLSGVKSGLYGNKNVIHSWTRGKGQLDPFISHYQYYSYPNILIIDKMGNVITANPYKNQSEVIPNIERYIQLYK
ncbi:redoxin domain-containing protein [Sphingobacterium sp. PCS056]|uniref:TlpA family protein disulfide reductase n=1 Tax=Sphingobacterium sp. PCS056 TaxID=2931400 RepID=UPI00200BF84A|nr:thioredoxin-like domain-containing protein [Sphingobacterium sp. PCS056]UPZ36505.1 redoxin domain-containing protein [Sphingobacterium sp. PCS056]